MAPINCQVPGALSCPHSESELPQPESLLNQQVPDLPERLHA